MCVDVFLSLNGAVIPNHGYVAINDISFSDNTALLCITNRPGTPTSGGWYGPDGTRVYGTDVPGVTINSGYKVVRLLKRTIGIAPEGIYWCSVEDATSTFQTIYVGLYNTGGGNVRSLNVATCWCSLYSGHLTLSGGMTFTLHNDNSFTLHWWTCYHYYLDQRLHNCHPRNPDCVE